MTPLILNLVEGIKPIHQSVDSITQRLLARRLLDPIDQLYSIQVPLVHHIHKDPMKR